MLRTQEVTEPVRFQLPTPAIMTAAFRPARPLTRRFDLGQMLPKHNRRDDQPGDLSRFVACLQEVTDLLLADVERWPDIRLARPREEA